MLSWALRNVVLVVEDRQLTRVEESPFSGLNIRGRVQHRCMAGHELVVTGGQRVRGLRCTRGHVAVKGDVTRQVSTEVKENTPD